MNDENIEDKLFDYFSGRLSEDEKAELLRWLEEDTSHKVVFSEMAEWWATAHVPAFMSDMRENFANKFAPVLSLSIQSGKSRSLTRGTLVKFAATLLLFLSLSVTFFYVGKQSSAKQDNIAWFETVTPYGAQTKVILPDKTVVWINSGSSLKYNKSFDKKVREVYLDGEAYFEVAHDSLKPFVVKSEALDIKVLGTRFNVKAYRNEETVDVCLAQGKVDVHFNEKTSSLPNVVMKPNQMVSYNKSSAKMDLTEVDTSDALAWVGGSLSFHEASFVEMSKQLERKFNVRIQIKSRTLKNEIFTGSFDNHYSLEEILQEVDIDKKYTWSRKDSNLIIYDRMK